MKAFVDFDILRSMKKVIIIIVTAAILVIALGYGFLAWRALEQAKSYEPPAGTLCTASITKARHDLTGVTATFKSGCLPDGWTAVQES